MRVKLFITMLFGLLFSGKVNSQGINNVWIMGYDHWAGLPFGNTVIDFKNNPASITYQDMSLSFRRTCSTISDTTGNLLFYTNGFAVCNALADTMPNGDSLDYNSDIDQLYENGMPTPQGTLIIKQPGDDSLYYLFHEGWELFIAGNGQLVLAPRHLFYSIINMNADSGKGDIIVKEQIAIDDTLTTGRTTAVKHANGRDWWIIKYKPYGDGYYSLLLTPKGLSIPFYQQVGPYLQYNSLGQAVFNPQGTKYANVDGINHLLIMDFDRCSGLFSNPIYIPILDSMSARGAAFSPSGRYLYITSNTYLYQYDVLSSNIDSSRQTVAVWDSFYSPSPPFAATFYNMQLAPDGKIYIAPPNGVKVLHTIDYPDSSGLSCSVCQHCVTTPAFYGYTLPNHPNYFLGAETGSFCDSITEFLETVYADIVPVKIYPNPAKDFFWLDSDLNNSNDYNELVIYNTLGEIILHKKLYNYFKSVKTDIRNLENGIYFIVVYSNNKKTGSGKLFKY